GPYKVYYEGGEIREEAVFKNNVREGTCTTYYEEGEVEVQAEFKEGRIISYREYDEKGKLKKPANISDAIRLA
ncbi:MAG: hypothetical protein WCQ99_15920, partial [Pseudomonadota bacterium]